MDLPVILYENKNNLEDLENLKKTYPFWRMYDIYENQLLELFNVINPHLLHHKDYEKKLSKFLKQRTGGTKKLQGNWIYFPWSGNLLHSVNEKEYLLLRTNRNRNLITLEEQKKLRDVCVGIVGLSVGSSIATGLVYQGIGRALKLAEFDYLETTNLNRMKAGIWEVGNAKLDVVARQIYEIDPYCNIELFADGLKKEVLSIFINKEPKPKIIFEMIDDFEMKIRLRMAARNAGIPVVSMANLGDSILLDIERYDIDKNLVLFNGVLGDLPEEIINNPNEDKNIYAVKMVGMENIPNRALKSVQEINKTLAGRPQLFSTVSVSGALSAYIARRIILGDDLISGRRRVVFDKLL